MTACLITGASSGLVAAFARDAAADLDRFERLTRSIDIDS